MDKEAYLKHKNKELKEKGFSNVQSQQIANSLYMQEGGSYSYQKTGNQSIAQSDIDKINQATGITFTPEFSQSYFSTQSTPNLQTNNAQVYSPKTIQDITSDGQFTNRKVWYTQKPEWFTGKKEPVQGQDYTTIPYSQWEAYQSSPEYMEYMAPQQTQVNSTSTASMQVGGQASVSPYAMNYPTFMNNFAPSPYIQRPQPITEPDFTGSPFETTSFANDPRTAQQQLGSPYQFSEDPTAQQNTTAPQKQYYNDITRYNIINPYSGVDLNTSLNYAGQGFGSGNAYQAALGTGLSVLKGARNFLTGYASGKESDRVKREQYEDLYNPKINYQYAQQGGQAKVPTNAEMLTGKYATDEAIGNYVVEGGEYLKRAKTGDVQEVIGEKHIKNGREAEGVNVNLENGDKVLSDYTKIPAKNVKELKERYDLSLRKGATFADAQKAYDKKLGIQKETDELATLIEKYGKNSTVKDETTRRLNDVVLSKEIEGSKKKLDLLGSPQSMMFEDLFAIQESLPKRGNGELLDKNGKPLAKEGTKKSYQMGGEIADLARKFNINTQRAHELIMLQEGGAANVKVPNKQEMIDIVSQSLQQNIAPKQILKILVDNLYGTYNNLPNEKTKTDFLNSLGINL